MGRERVMISARIVDCGCTMEDSYRRSIRMRQVRGSVGSSGGWISIASTSGALCTESRLVPPTEAQRLPKQRSVDARSCCYCFLSSYTLPMGSMVEIVAA